MKINEDPAFVNTHVCTCVASVYLRPFRQELVRPVREPIERDTLYRPVTRTETSVTVAV